MAQAQLVKITFLSQSQGTQIFHKYILIIALGKNISKLRAIMLLPNIGMEDLLHHLLEKTSNVWLKLDPFFKHLKLSKKIFEDVWAIRRKKLRTHVLNSNKAFYRQTFLFKEETITTMHYDSYFYLKLSRFSTATSRTQTEDWKIVEIYWQSFDIYI